MANSWLYAPLHKPLCDFFQEDDQYEAITLPRSFLKTTIALLYCAWELARKPLLQILNVTNNDDNAAIKGGEFRKMIERAPLVTQLWPHLRPNARWSAHSIVLEGNPTGYTSLYFVGLGRDLTGTHWDIVLPDDTLTLKKDKMTGIEMMPSMEDVQKSIGFHMSITHLRKSPATSKIKVIGTRWALQDLFAHIKEKEPHYRFFERTAWVQADTGELLEDGSRVLPTYPIRGNGEMAFPISELIKIKQQNPYLFYTLYLNSPIDPTKQSFKKDQFKYFKGDCPKNGLHYVMLDPAYSQDKKACDTAICDVLLKEDGDWYVNQYMMGKMPLNEIISRTLDIAIACKAYAIGYEDVAAQKFLVLPMEQAMLERRVWFKLIPIKTQSGHKVDRIASMQPMFYNGRVWFRQDMVELENQLIGFPMNSKRDLADCLSFMTHVATPLVLPKPVSEVEEYDRLFGFEAIVEEAEEKARERQIEEMVA
jgi:phage terminase large subunit-like protein